MGAHGSKDRPSGFVPPPTKMRLGSFKRGSAKKREAGRSRSTLSDGSTNLATPPTGPPRQSPRSGEERARDSGAANPQKRQPMNVRSLGAAGSKRRQLLDRRSTPVEERNGVSGAPVVDMKTPACWKGGPRRAPATIQKSTPPLRDHNGRQQQVSSGANKVSEVGHAPRKVPATPPQPSPEVRLLPLLRHNSCGFEALGVLVQYLVFDLEAFATPQLRRNLEQLNGEHVRTKLELEEVQASYRRLGEEMCQKVAAHKWELEQAAVGYHQKLADLEAARTLQLAQLSEEHAAQVSELENRHQQLALQQLAAAEERQRELLTQLEQERREGERLAGELAWRDADHQQAAREAAAREAELQQRLVAIDKENREEWRHVMDDLRKDKDTKLQVTAGRCKELQDEVQSLQAVLELRSQEIQQLRRQNAELTWTVEEVHSARQHIQSLQARVEDLQAQLHNKTIFERQLLQENRQLLESKLEENKQKRRLSLRNEELQYRLKQNEEFMLTALSTSLRSPSVSSSSDSSKTPSSLGHHQVLQHLAEPPTFLQLPLHSSGDSSPPQSPKVKSMVQKGDSVSWTLAMEEAPEIYSRLLRRAGSFRGTTGNVTLGCGLSPVRSRTLPPPKRQRCKASSLCVSSSAAVLSPQQSQSSGGSFSVPGHARSRSVSMDSANDAFDTEAYDWPNAQRNLLEEFANCNDVNRALLEYGGNEVEGGGKSIGLAGDAGSTKRCSPSENSNEADSPSKSSTSSSSSSSSNGPVQNGKCAEHLGGYHWRKGSGSQLNVASSTSESMDNVDPEVLPLPPLPGSSSGDLSLLAACSAVQNAKMPKESGGEAMISEETSEDENQRDVVNSSSDEQSCSDDESSSSSSLEMENGGI